MPHPLTVSEMAANSMRTGILPLVAPRIQRLHWYLKVSRYFDRRGETSQRGVQHEPAPDIQHLHAVEGGAGFAVGHGLAQRQMLQLGDDLGGAWVVDVPEVAIDPWVR